METSSFNAPAAFIQDGDVGPLPRADAATLGAYLGNADLAALGDASASALEAAAAATGAGGGAGGLGGPAGALVCGGGSVYVWVWPAATLHAVHAAWHVQPGRPPRC
jgi:hypothetical protein